MKTYTNKNLIKAWYSNENLVYEGRTANNNLFFNSDALYSYGEHFPLAYKIKGKVIINIDSYSTTTSQHQAIVRNIVNNPIETNTRILQHIITNDDISICDVVSNALNLADILIAKSKKRRNKEYKTRDIIKSLDILQHAVLLLNIFGHPPSEDIKKKRKKINLLP